MDTREIVITSFMGLALCFCVAAVLDCIRRDIPPLILKFRLLSVPYTILNIALVVTSATSTPNFVVRGTLTSIADAMLLLMHLYSLENFVKILMGK